MSDETTTTLVVPFRFRGPATSGNGGWASGALAALLVGAADPAPAVRVRLSAPPPLDTPMTVGYEGETATASVEGRVVATATRLDRAGGEALEPVPPVSLDAADAATRRYPGLTDHPFPECFACGTARPDGLGLRPGPVDDAAGPRVAAVWRPDPSVTDEAGRVPLPVVWAALDCPGGWSVDIAGRPMVLGTMTAWVHERPLRGEPLVVVGRAREVSERKALTGSSLYRPDGRLLAVATHVWVAVDPAAFGTSPAAGGREKDRGTS